MIGQLARVVTRPLLILGLLMVVSSSNVVVDGVAAASPKRAVVERDPTPESTRDGPVEDPGRPRDDHDSIADADGPDESSDSDDPDQHDPAEAARSDRSLGSWLLVAAALIVATLGIAFVLRHDRHRRR